MQCSVPAKRLILGVVDVRASLEVRQQFFERVALIFDLAGPFVVGAIGSSMPQHEVERAGAAESLSTRIVDTAISESGLRCCDKAPINQR